MPTFVNANANPKSRICIYPYLYTQMQIPRAGFAFAHMLNPFLFPHFLSRAQTGLTPEVSDARLPHVNKNTRTHTHNHSYTHTHPPTHKHTNQRANPQAALTPEISNAPHTHSQSLVHTLAHTHAKTRASAHVALTPEIRLPPTAHAHECHPRRRTRRHAHSYKYQRKCKIPQLIVLRGRRSKVNNCKSTKNALANTNTSATGQLALTL